MLKLNIQNTKIYSREGERELDCLEERELDCLPEPSHHRISRVVGDSWVVRVGIGLSVLGLERDVKLFLD